MDAFIVILNALTIYCYRVKDHLEVAEVTDTATSFSLEAPTECSWVKICDDPLKMCHFTNKNLIDYFVNLREEDGLQRQDWKSLNAGGYKLFAEGHVQDIYVSISSDNCKVKAICLPEMKKDDVYSLNVTITVSSGSVNSASCKCPAGRGPMASCKHLAALCFCLEDFIKLRNATLEIGEAACTSVLQKWNQPRKRRLDSKKAEEISFKCPVPSYAEKAKRRCERKAYDPRPLTMRKTTTVDLDELKMGIQELPTACGFLHLLCGPTDETTPADPDITLPLTPRSVQCRFKDGLLKMPLPPSFTALEELGKQFVVDITPGGEHRNNIEIKTRPQSYCARWHEERYCRLTASNFGAVVKRRSNHQKLAQSLLSDKTVPSTVRAIRWGREHESVAFEEYSRVVGERYPNLILRKCGFYIGNPGYLGASPDGVLVDQFDSVVGIIEIKCPYSAAKLTVQEACTHCNDFYCYLNDDGEVKLNNTHAYYFQVLGTMAVTEAHFCDFIIWTPKSTEILNIKFNEEEWQQTAPVLANFYTKYMLPQILY